MGNLNMIGMAAMPAAASENTPEKLFGVAQANRRCRERHEAIGRLQVGRKVRKESPGKVARLAKGGTEAPDGSRKGAWFARTTSGR